ncbi:hypothetical protein HR060_18300 [Catenovulum sp. SM1970]|uniref:hypothetical protein n=1 Tax=Marinifaba aquimaris TaxID=2741323 RepID=UPI001574CAE8|nr:hypothetical protein [Marinifaba aquimaris]NTS78796.1 hypothetical protein [Marinifaba aquimaris]
MFKYRFHKSVLLLALIFGFSPAYADFDTHGQAQITYPSGVNKAVDFSFAFKPLDGQQYFFAGPYKMATQDVPQHYAMAILLTKEEHLWVQEFGQGYFEELSYQLGDYLIEAKKSPDRDVRGHYTLYINGNAQLFDRRTIQILVEFEEDVISNVRFQEQ